MSALRIEGKTYTRSDLSRVSALTLLRASEELPALGLRTTWDDLMALMSRSMLPVEDQGEWSQTDKLWLGIFTIWATLNAAGRECTLRDAMDLVSETEVIESPQDHQPGKVKAPASRKGSGRGGVPARKAPKTLS